MKLDPIITTVLSDLYINLAAGWLGVVFIIPFTSQDKQQLKFGLLLTNITLAILSLAAAVTLRKL